MVSGPANRDRRSAGERTRSTRRRDFFCFAALSSHHAGGGASKRFRSAGEGVRPPGIKPSTPKK
ncbi:MAG: hypothetical protein CMJ52_10060 [Planctomycetaceae bacterium]|nr:hypothetical protein [Planctomycetaceae bacterium]